VNREGGSLFSLVDGIRVQSDIIGCVVKNQCLEVLQAVRAEEEGVDLGSKTLESKVGGCKQSATIVKACVVESVEKTCLVESEFKSRKLSWEGSDDIDYLRRRQEDRVKTMNDTIRTEYVKGNDSSVEVDSQAPEANLSGHSLWDVLDKFCLQSSRECSTDQNAASWGELRGDVVGQDLLQLLLGWLGGMFGDLLERTVDRSEDGVVGLSAVQRLDKVVVLVDELGELVVYLLSLMSWYTVWFGGPWWGG